MSGEYTGAPAQGAQPGVPLIIGGSTVAMLVSTGAPQGVAGMVEVPDVLGQKQTEALETLQAAGFVVEVLRNPSASFPVGAVSHQLPVAGSAMPRGARVCVFASTGPVQEGTPHVVLPDTVGKTKEEASALLQQAGLRAAVIEAANPAVAAGVVFAQEPNARTVGREPEKKSKAWIWILLIAVLAIAALAAFFLFSGGKQVEVPDVTGMKTDAAELVLTDAGLVLGKVTEEETEAVKPGLIISSDPVAGKMVDEESRVDVVVAVGLAGVKVPDVVGDSADDAKATLEAAGLTVRAEEVFSDKVDKGDVVAQSPQPGTRVQKGAEVALSVSKGEEPVANVKVPDLSGMTEDEARSALDKVGLEGVDLLAYSATVPKGDVGAQAPASGASVAPGTQVAFILSKGPAPAGSTEVAVPNVTGLPKGDAKDALDSAGFKVEELESPHQTVAKDSVIAQLPIAGQMATEGSVVVIMVSTGPAQ